MSAFSELASTRRTTRRRVVAGGGRHQVEPITWRRRGDIGMGVEARAIGSTIAISATILGATWTTRADAAPDDPLRLKWSAPSECPSEIEITARARDIVGTRARPRQPIDARVVVSRTDAEWHAEIRLESETRAVKGESCEALGDAVAVILALAVDHGGSEPDSPPPSPPEAPDRTTPSSPPRRPFFVGAALGVGAGTLPSADVGPAVVVGFNAGRLRLGLDLGLTAKVDGRTAERPEEGASFWLARGGVRGSWALVQGALNIGPCLGVSIERIAADGFGAPRPKSNSAVLTSGSVGVLALLRVAAPLYLGATLDGTVPLARPSFSIDGTGTVHRVAALGARATIGAEVHF